jgi:hypothetical protein
VVFVHLSAAAPPKPGQDRPEVAHVRATIAVHVVWLTGRVSSMTCRYVSHFKRHIAQRDRAVGVDVAPA